jgi:hypothetical protein
MIKTKGTYIHGHLWHRYSVSVNQVMVAGDHKMLKMNSYYSTGNYPKYRGTFLFTVLNKTIGTMSFFHTPRNVEWDI